MRPKSGSHFVEQKRNKINHFSLIFQYSNQVFKNEEQLSLSMIVLNSRDWSEIVWLPEISCFKINLAISFIQTKPTGMHWLGYNDAVSSLNEAKTRIFQPIANFENFEIRLHFVCQPASLP